MQSWVDDQNNPNQEMLNKPNNKPHHQIIQFAKPELDLQQIVMNKIGCDNYDCQKLYTPIY
jgi:hypothetical protein